MRRISKRNALVWTTAAALASAVASMAPAWAQKTEITFAGVTFSEAGRGDKLRAWVDKFNKSQDKIEVKTLGLPFSQFANTMFTQMGGGGGPDLVRFDTIDFYVAVPAGRILPFDDFIKDSDYKFSAPNDYLKVDGKRYGVAFEISNYVMMYNPAVLKGKVPATFDELLAVAKASATGGNFGYAYRATMAERNGFWQDLCNYVFGFGGRWSDGKNLTLNSPKVVEGITAYKKMYDSGAIPRGADAATYRRMFWENKVAIEIDNGGVAGIFNQQAPNLKFQAAPSPFPTRAQGLILAPLTVNANTKHKSEAFAFVKWALEPSNQKDLQDILGASSVAIPVPRSEQELAVKPWLKVYDEQTPNAVPQLVGGLEVKTPELQQIIIEQVLKVLQGGMDPQKAMDEAQQLAEAKIKK